MAELLFTLYLLSGIAKVFIKFFLGDSYAEIFNTTLIFAALLVLVCVFQGFKHIYFKSKLYFARGSLPSMTLLLFFYLWMMVSLIYTVSPQYSYFKTFVFLTNLVAFWFPLAYKDFAFQRFTRYFVLVATVFIVLYLSVVPRSYGGSLDNLELSVKYLDMGFLSALNILLLILPNVCTALGRWLKLGLGAVNLASLVICGARGPLVFMILVLVLYVFFHPRQLSRFLGRWSLKKALVVAVSPVILMVVLYQMLVNYAFNIERSIGRLNMVLDVESSSLEVRISQMSFAVKSILASASNFLLGSGIGSFGILYGGEDIRLYPHNMILETWFEMGAVGIFFLMLFFLFYLKKIRRNSPSLYIFLYLLLNSLKSYSLVDLRVMFGVLACLLVFTNSVEQETSLSEQQIIDR
jgi:O-antigen ligase